MSTSTPIVAPIGPTGWTCQRCKAFVPNGCTHHCPTTAVFPPMPSPPPLPVSHEATALHRIAAALERIADALDES